MTKHGLLKPICKQCGESVKNHHNKFCSKRCYQSSMRGIKGEKSNRWKGDLVGKAGVHHWLYANYGKPKQCEICGTTDPLKNYDWASKDHKYRRERTDFMRLCRSCHFRFDGFIPPSRSGKAHSEASKQAIRSFTIKRARARDGKFL